MIGTTARSTLAGSTRSKQTNQGVPMRRFTSKRFIGALSVIAVLAAAGAAIAFFTSSGTGSGSATVGTSTAWTVGQTGTTGPALLPDPAIGTGNIQTKSYQVTNPSSGSQNLKQVVVSIANGNGSGWSSPADNTKPACTAADFSVGGQPVGQSWTDTSLSGDYTAGSSQSGTATVQMIDNGANQDNCQGVTVPLYFQAS
jgi:hypothetical protein